MEQNQNQQIQATSPQQHQISATELAATYSSKRKCYNFLAVDAGVYLPAYEQVTIYFLKDLVSGKKKCKFSF